MMISGAVCFSNVIKQDQWKGQDTGFSLTLTLNDSDAEILGAEGVKIKDYEGTQQRKFRSGFQPEVIDMAGDPVTREIPRGSLVRVLVKLGADDHPQWGRSTYIDKVRLVEEAEGQAVPDDF